MAFRPLKKISELDYRSAIIGNSEAITVGDAIIPGATTHAAAVIGAKNTTGIILGVVTAIVPAEGMKPLEVQSYTVASNNETVAKIRAEYIPCYIPMEYEADLSQAAGTTTNSDLMQQFNLSATLNGTLDETSTGAFSTQKQFFSYGVTPYSTTKVRGKFSTTKVV